MEKNTFSDPNISTSSYVFRFLLTYVYVSVSVYVHLHAGTHSSPKSVSDLLKLEFHVV